MKKAALFLFVSIIVSSCGFFTYSVLKHIEESKKNPLPIIRYMADRETPVQTRGESKGECYEVYEDGQLYNRYDSYNEALVVASSLNRAGIRMDDDSQFIWDNYPPYNVFINNNVYIEFESFTEALDFGRKQKNAHIYYRKDNSLIWQSEDVLPGEHIIQGVPLILQYPELPRGCEVTSLNMLLEYKNIVVDKMDLARDVRRDNTPYEERNGEVYFGNPYDGFVGDMYDLQERGFGVYHKPVHELMETYLPYSSLDLTGCEFDDLLAFIAKGVPVWVIINGGYMELPPENFQTWNTPSGKIEITMREHSVLVIGYDENYIYFNDPLDRMDKADRQDFKEGWIQMGKQAITSTP